MDLKATAPDFIRSAFDFIFPRNCHICGITLSAGSRYICPSCLMKLPRTRFHRQPMNQMEQRFAGRFPFEAATANFFYSSDTAMATLMHDLKYRHYRGLAEFMGETVAKELLVASFFHDVDSIIPVPMHPWKQSRRGYNQTIEIAKGISKVLNVPVLGNLKAVKRHKTQTRLTLDQRIDNLYGTFSVINPEQLCARHILLLDDVCTTGATLTSCADTLLAAEPSVRLTLLSIAATS